MVQGFWFSGVRSQDPRHTYFCGFGVSDQGPEFRSSLCNERVSARVGVGVRGPTSGFRGSVFGLLVTDLRFRSSDQGAGSWNLGARTRGFSCSAAHRDKSREWNVSKQKWNLC